MGAPLSPFGKLPKAISVIIIIIFSFLWLYFVDSRTKILTIVASLCYSFQEYSWVGTTIESPNGEVVFRPFDKNCRKPHTTFEQFYANIFLLPFIIPIYLNFLSKAARLILFPLMIWSIEITQGYFLMLLYGYNPAWHYKGTDARFHGNIKLGYGKSWFVMGLVWEGVILLTGIV